MSRHEFPVPYQGRILGELLRELAMRAKKASETGALAVHVTTHAIFATIEASLLVHERLRVFVDFLADVLVSAQVLLKRGMVIQELLVVYQTRILAKLFGDFVVLVQELVEAGKLPASGVVVTNGLARDVMFTIIGVTRAAVEIPIVKAICTAHESVRIFL